LRWDADGDGDVDTSDANALIWSSVSDFFGYRHYPGILRSMVRKVINYRVAFFGRTATAARPIAAVSRLTALDFIADIEDLVEDVQDVLIGPQDTRVFLTKQFDTLKHVSWSIQQLDDDTGTQLILIKKKQGFLIFRALDYMGDRAVVHADITVRGAPAEIS
jgi:hypothetical protein